MGYRCPNCHKDFGFDKDKLDEHLLNNPECNVEAFLYTDILPIALGIKKAKYPYGDRGKKEVKHRVVDEVSPNHVWVKENLVTNSDGSDTMVCNRCGLKATRVGSSMKFDMRFTHKIKYCCD